MEAEPNGARQMNELIQTLILLGFFGLEVRNDGSVDPENTQKKNPQELKEAEEG